MTQTVHLLGTNHGYQFGVGAQLNRNRTCSEHDVQLFRKTLLALCHSLKVTAIAEEMNADALAERSIVSTVPQAVAASLAIAHKHCDPDRKAQAALGMADENGVIAMNCMSGRSKREVRALVYEERRKREPYWKSELEALGVWPVLFICGSWHVPSFLSLRTSAGYSTTVVHSSWHA